MLLTRNAKLKKSKKRTFNFSIPALKTDNGYITCPNAGICAASCYARSHHYLFQNVKDKHYANFIATTQANFVQRIVYELNKLKVDRVRIHDAGDFYLTDNNGMPVKDPKLATNTHYIDKWISIMLLAPKVEFYAYTKNVEIFKEYALKGVLPKNFTVIYSIGGKQDQLIDPNTDRHSLPFEKIGQLKRAGYIDASNNDDKALGKSNKIGLIYHGMWGYKNTSWARLHAQK